MTLSAVFPHARALLPALALLASVAAAAADGPDTVLARRGDVVITRADWDAELLRIPAKDRADFASNLRRNYGLLERMLTTRELALEAKQKKLDADPLTRVRVRQEEERILAAALIASAEEAAARDFELRQPVFERRARELYDIDKAKYSTPETVMITVLFFSAAKDGAEGAERRAQAALAKIKAGADIGDLASAVSDDPTTREIRGKKGPLARADLDATLAQNAFALKNKGDVSDVVHTREGVWIVRLDERKASVPRPYDEVKGAILADLKQQQIDAARAALVTAVAGGKEISYNPPAIEALRPPPKTSP
jgi:peptidyl-prolyl cis-trans isomerase C